MKYGPAISGLIAGLVVSVASSSELTIPNTFSAGTKASAAQVNQNFSATATAVNDNSAKIIDARTRLTAVEGTVADHGSRLTAVEQAVATSGTGSGLPVLSGSSLIGYFVALPSWQNDAAWLISDKGYLFRIELTWANYLDEAQIYFEGANCSGTRYASYNGPGWILETGAVFRESTGIGTSNEIYYVPRSATSASRTYASLRTNNSCVNQIGTATAYVTLPNDENVTGVPNVAPQRPLTFAVP